LKGFNAMVYVERTKFESLPTSYTISGLTSSQRYVARVRGYNGDFWNSPVTSAIAVAPQLSAASIPLNVRTSLLSEAQILVFWNSPEDNGGSPISGYLVEWDVDSSFSENANSFLVTSKMYYEISRLVSNSTYYIRVSAYNTQGYSPFAIAESVTQWADIQVIDVESNAAVTSTFTLSVFDGFRTEQTSSIDAVTSPEVIQAALQDLDCVISVLVSKVDESTNYDSSGVGTETVKVSYRVTFIDSMFYSNVRLMSSSSPDVIISGHVNGVPQLEHSIRTGSTYPSAPENVLLTSISNTELGVRWSVPKYNGGSLITKYLVEWDTNPYFIRGNRSAYSQVLSVDEAAGFSTLSDFAYQSRTYHYFPYLFEWLLLMSL